MLFNSLRFLYFFLPLTWFVFWKLRTSFRRQVWLTLTGYIFYSFWNPKFCLLMALSTAVSYTAGLGFLRWHDPRRRRLCLILPVALDLTLLGIFKYANFALASGAAFFRFFHVDVQPPLLDIVLPVGISFYTFHTITYIVDAYRGVITPTRNIFEFSCYVSLFSQLVAGPIVRFRQVEHDIGNLDSADRVADLERGCSFFILGLAKKVVLADSIAAIINPALAHWTSLSTGAAWLCALGYTYQLYFDFSGYSDMAVGLASLFGIRLPQNFNSPYKATDISDFWSRWHMSLSTVLRDYLYFPLGGSRFGPWLTARNLMVTMLLGGLWHGAGWTFVAWGAWHGSLLVANRFLPALPAQVPAFFRCSLTFLLVVLGWVLFRSDSFPMAWGLLTAMFSWRSGLTIPTSTALVLMLVVAAFLAHAGPNTFELRHRWNPAASVALGVALVGCLIMMYAVAPAPFLYFQF